MKKVAIGIVSVLVFTASCAKPNYYSCEGVTGIAANQSILPLLSKVISSDESEVDGSMRITADSVIVDGIPFVASAYKICHNGDQGIWFSPGGNSDYCAENDLFDDLGVFNKVTGKFSYHAGDFLAILQCEKTIKSMN